MARQKVSIDVAPIAVLAVAAPDDDPSRERILDAASDLMVRYGLRRWSMDDVAEVAGIGRTSVYRSFSSREDLVHAVLAGELRQTLTDVKAAGDRYRRLEDRVIEGALTALGALRGSLVERLLRSDPATLLPFLTTDAGGLVALARRAVVESMRSQGLVGNEQQAAEVAEVAARLGLSFILTRDTVFPLEDPEELRASLRRLLRPVLAAVTGSRPTFSQ